MLVYSKKIIEFIDDIKISLKFILAYEMRLKVYGDRFYDRGKQYSFPINIVIFNDKSMLGYFDSQFYELCFHESLMHSSKKQLQNIIRHELAHYMIFIKYGNTVEPHGAEFKAFCRDMKWEQEVQKASMHLNEEAAIPSARESSILRKVQKLMALSESYSKNEAEQAMIKVQQLLLKHNIDLKNIKNDEDEKMFLKRILKQKKKNAKMSSIAKILETFFVNVVFNRQGGCTYLEIVGSAVNVEIAGYVANILQDKLDMLWLEAKKQHVSLKGTIAKNSFFLGVAMGYCKKIQFFKKQYDGNTSNALMVLEKKLEEIRSMVYRRLTMSNSYANCCSESSALGEKAGKQLNINPALNNSAKNSYAYLSFQQE